MFAVVAPLPWYKGCYSISATFIDKASLTGNMTVARCLHRCNDYRYAKLQVKFVK